MRLIKAFSLFELILVIFISSIVLISTSMLTKEFLFTQKENEKLAILKLDLNSTKIIIEKNLPEIINKLRYENQTLYINENILLKDVTSFSMKKEPKYLNINITLDKKIKQNWEFGL
ncbi:hypothetical protein [Halarcobacter anaerophilus]|uniref:Prepilin-type cleavage/methylation domain-containing protein n=1 Tax=Halarcobacter anaerophilus TaxID=877500 RepID=A0A4Q0XX34_9BACT|nr:hypothetical protein [Halarcobacter anaerophilus]QDF28250.1 hypothetical protein AANAER_0756 [Halarcobacter anaerophilus]RXJ62082.1 hypothetical protein CRV06_11665 [Halarcobacter anaerophilus]